MTTPETPAKTNPVRILIVDDHPNTAAMLARALTQIGPGVNVVSAASGHEALDKVRNTGVDILITDMIMPEMTGLELIEKLQKHPGGKPSFTYLVTAYDVPGLKVTAQRLKVNDVIIKPVRPEKISQIVQRAMEEMKHSTHPPTQLAASKRKFKVLVADDRPDNVTLLIRYLEYEGYDSITATDGIETLEKIRDELPDLVLLDVNMPNKDGFTVLEEVRADPAVAHIPVIILTAARLDSSDVQSGLNLGADDYVTKPFDRNELMARIRTKLRVKEAEDVIRRRNRELSILPEIGKDLSARPDIKDLANVLLKRTVETLGAIQGNMFLMDDAGGISENFQVSLVPAETKTEFILSEKLIRQVRETHQGVIIANALSDPLWQKETNSSIRSALAVPLFGRHTLLGLLILTHEQERYFSMDHLLLLQAIASQAAIAIENTRLYANTAQEQKRLNVILQNAAEAILLFDAQGRLNMLNPAGEKLFTDFNTKLNQPLPVQKGYDGFVRLLDEARASNLSKSGEVIWPDQRTFTALITPIEDGGQVAILHDVTRFKDLDRVKNEFIATASHDLKNPITTIAGFSSLIVQAGPLNAKQEEFINHIQNAANTMIELVQNMLSLAQMDIDANQKHETMDMNDLLAEINNEFSAQAKLKKQTLSFIAFKSPAPVAGDPLQLRQLFRNLIGNAIKYTPEDGSIQVTAKPVDGQLVISVLDSGYGIPAADLPFIFNRFYRARNGDANKEEGNGLGLAIVKSIVEQHGGMISVESEVGKGACFTLSLPLV